MPEPTNTRDKDELDYWYANIDENDAAEYADLSIRTLQTYRQRGNGPKYIQVSNRCIRYRRIDLRHWQDTRLVTSTSDEPGVGTEEPHAVCQIINSTRGHKNIRHQTGSLKKQREKGEDGATG